MRIIRANMLDRSEAMTTALAILDGEREPDEFERLIAYALVRYAARLVRKAFEEFRKRRGLEDAGDYHPTPPA